jgi:hypothetical protein
LITVGRILDVDDDDVDVSTIDWKNTPMPSATSPSSSTNPSKDDKMEVDDEWDGVDSITPHTSSSSSSSSSSKKHSKISRGRNKESSPEPKPSSRLNERLHGPACWMVVKWDGLPYGEATFEDVDDLRNYCSVNTYARMKSNRVEGQNGEAGVSGSEDKRADEIGIEYEQPLRDFYRREQRAPSKIHATGQKRYNRSLSRGPCCIPQRQRLQTEGLSVGRSAVDSV